MWKVGNYAQKLGAHYRIIAGCRAGGTQGSKEDASCAIVLTAATGTERSTARSEYIICILGETCPPSPVLSLSLSLSLLLLLLLLHFILVPNMPSLPSRLDLLDYYYGPEN